MQTNKIIWGDCLNVMQEIPAKSVNLTFCSPPYEDARTYGELDFKLTGKAWVDWCVDRFLQCVRVTNGLVAWVVQGRTRKYRWSATPALLIAALHEHGVNLREPCIFHRSGIPGSGGPDYMRRDYEWIITASDKGKLPWSDNTAMGQPPKFKKGGDPTYRTVDGKRIRVTGGKGKAIKRGTNRGLNQNCEHEEIGSETVEYQPYIPPKLANPGNIIDETEIEARSTIRKIRVKAAPDKSGDTEDWTRTESGLAIRESEYRNPAINNPGNLIDEDYIATVVKCSGGHLGSKLAHEGEAPFPESLAEFFIRSFCPPGGTVLDPFSGSGTTAAVAKKLNRQFIGIDIRESQVDLANKRLTEEAVS